MNRSEIEKIMIKYTDILRDKELSISIRLEASKELCKLHDVLSNINVNQTQ